MEITIFDQVVLLLTGLIAVYLTYRFYQEFKESDVTLKRNIHYMIAFVVLFVSGVLIIFLGFTVLEKPIIGVIATLLPFGIAMGLVCEFYEKNAKFYAIFLLIGLVLIALEQFGVIEVKSIYPVFHSIAGFTIFAIPIIAVKNKWAHSGFIWVTVGGTIIGIGGMALAFLGIGKPLLGIFTEELVFTILTPILLLMVLGFTYGFVKKMKNPIK